MPLAVAVAVVRRTEGGGGGGEGCDGVVSKTNFEILLNLLRKLGWGEAGIFPLQKTELFILCINCLRNPFSSKRPLLNKT